MHLVLNTRLSNFPRFDLPLTNRDQPRIQEIAAIFHDDDGNEVERLHWPVRQNSSVYAYQEAAGGSIGTSIFYWIKRKAAVSELIIGHNALVDIWAIRVLGARSTGQNWQPGPKVHCTMLEAVRAMDMSDKSPIDPEHQTMPRAMTLPEAMRYFCKSEFIEASGPLAHVRATYRLYKALAARP